MRRRGAAVRSVGMFDDVGERVATRFSAAAVLAAVCALTFGMMVGQASAVPVGPGPGSYSVQPQPAPGSCHYRNATSGAVLPDPGCTPGALNPRVDQANLASTICHSGYSGSIRPPVSVTAPEKRANAQSYGYTGPPADTEYDHLVSLELGGDPNDPRNLWVEPGASPNPKDSVENTLHQLVCSGAVPLAAAQQAIATDWTTALAVVGHPPLRLF